MCGIFGTINLSYDDTVLDLIRHRGPDSCGTTTLTVGYHQVKLGHRRLSIVDLSAAGHQPMQSFCSRHVIVYNGEVYNHTELRSALENTPFKGYSDTETILYYLARYGITAVREFNGIFSFCYIDVEQRKLFLARDPFGVKPLYYCQRGETFLFSSEIRPIQKIVQDSVDSHNIGELLRLRYSPSPDTLFRNIKKVRPGHIIEIDLSVPELCMKEYSFLEVPKNDSSLLFQEAIGIYSSLFAKAVKRQLMSDVELGILLSGGIDSALVGAFAQKHVPYRMKAFTVGFEESDNADEIRDAQETASTFDLDHFYTRVTFEDFLSTIRECVGIVEEPLATTSVIPMYYLSKLASNHVKVVLSGQGADEPLGGYGRYQGELYRKMLPSYLIKLAGPLFRFTGIRNEQILRGLEALGEKREIERFLKVYSVFNDDEIFLLTGKRDNKSIERIMYFFDLIQCEKLNHSVERMMSLDLRMNLSDDLLLYTDKITMHFSLECRVPILDHNLIHFVESLPSSYRVALWKTKIIHKAFARTILPESIVTRRKKGFLSPTGNWFRQKSEIKDVLQDPSSKFATHFDLREVSKVLDQHEMGYDRERHIFLLLCISFWMERFA